MFRSRPDGAGNLLISRTREDVREFQWAPDSERVAYTAEDIGLNKVDLYSSSNSGSASPQLQSFGVSTGQQVSTFKWASDSSRIAFLVDRQITGVFRLFTVIPGVPTNVEIGRPPDLNDVTDFKWQPNPNIPVNSEQRQIAYRVNALQFELYTTFPADLFSIQIRDTRPFPGDVFDYKWATDNSRIAYTADFDEAGVIELFSSLPDDTETFKVSGELADGGDVGEFKWAPDSTGIGYIADQDFNTVDELYASQPNGLNNFLLSGELVVGGDVTRFEWVP